MHDIYNFLNILKKYNCIISAKYNFFILSLIPIFSLIIKLGPGIEKKDFLKLQLNKMSNNMLSD